MVMSGDLVRAHAFAPPKPKREASRPILPDIFQIVVDCQSESHQTELLADFAHNGVKCRALIACGIPKQQAEENGQRDQAPPSSTPARISATITRSVAILHTPRVQQLSGLFDLQKLKPSRTWQVDLDLPAMWNVGVIGPSGCGKSTIATELFGGNLVKGWRWSADKSILDGFPADMSILEITGLLSSVGFSSAPSWLCPFHILSNGEQFRVNLARALAELPDLAVIDEFTSIVDRPSPRSALPPSPRPCGVGVRNSSR